MEPALDARSECPSNLDFGKGSSFDAIKVSCRVENRVLKVNFCNGRRRKRIG
jgi:hypothetical protein